MATGQVRVGVIGVGRMGQRHCRIYATMRRAQLMGVCDVSTELGRKIARQYEASFYRQIDDLLDNVDAVSLATPTPLHYDLAMRCIEHGVHVLIEKPIAETLEQAEAIAKAAEASHVVVMVGHIERFNPPYLELKHVLDNMKPLAINVRRLSAYEGSNTDVDVVLDLMIHDTNLMLDLVGREPTQVHAFGLTAYSGSIDHAVAQLEFEAGPLVTMTASRVTEQKVRSIEATAHEAYIECDLLTKVVLVHRRTLGQYPTHEPQGGKYRQESVMERIHVPVVEPQFAEQEHFIDCILNNRPPLVLARDGFKALQLAMTIRNQILNNLKVMNKQATSRR
jgi:virulence factor